MSYCKLDTVHTQHTSQILDGTNYIKNYHCFRQ